MAYIRIKNASDKQIECGNSADFSIQAEKEEQWYNIKPLGEFANTAYAVAINAFY